MKSILHLKHWQVFLIAVFGLALSNLTGVENALLRTVLGIIGGTTYFLWPLIVSIALYKVGGRMLKLNYRLFIVNAVIWLVAHVFIIVHITLRPLPYAEAVAIPGLYLIYAFIHYHAFPARLINSMELGRKATVVEYMLDFLLIVLLPVGVWILQPRVNRLAEHPENQSL